jgi:hypothetical protein
MNLPNTPANTHLYLPSPAAVESAWVSGMPGYQHWVAQAQADPQAFWADRARALLR